MSVLRRYTIVCARCGDRYPCRATEYEVREEIDKKCRKCGAYGVDAFEPERGCV